MKKLFKLYINFLSFPFKSKIGKIVLTVFSILAIGYMLIYGERIDKYTEWTNDFDQAKSKYCKCMENARKIRNLEKLDKEERDCSYKFRLFYNKFEDASNLSDSLFTEIDNYIQREFNTPCK